ncbi:Uncharacterized protein OBRU01_04578 [Operophtera brumata]|uniref:Uncharacterized protein n=1 Tax=Operophtera brumata TaxID=104452 RepID=A0A0L7LPX1_OPEBR|nr:Uncharacterized protein OBRU01_04578 [Operophtera brumata]
MVTSDNSRWKYTHPELSPYHGQIPGVDRFDAQFFMVNSKIGHNASMIEDSDSDVEEYIPRRTRWIRLVQQNSDGKTKCYDTNADGQSLSESVSVIYLQKYKDARRVYAQLCHVETGYSKGLDAEFMAKFGHYRDPAKISKFLSSFYDDAAELQAIEEVFCKERTNPLLVGSVTSNMGFTKSVSGLNGIIKIIHGYQTGVLAANLNCDNPRQDVAAIRDGRIKIMTAHHPTRSGLPYLVTISSRQESGVERVLNNIKNNNLDMEELALLREVYKMRTSNHLARGFGIFASDINNKTETLCENVGSYDEIKRPLWFVYSGMGSQWTGMGVQLMRIPIFAAAILRCDKVLKPKGIDIVKIITSNDEKTFENILNAFVGITAIQIALTDVLLATILLSYSRGLVSSQLPFIKGSMAAVGLGHKEVSKLCPPEIVVACHNGPDSSTLSGPAEIIQKFVQELTALGIFAKEVKCANIAYHSQYIAKAGPVFLKMGQAIVKTPKLRSKRWLSTSVPVEKLKQNDALYSSAEYHTNNLLNSVLFEEASRMIASGAVLVEIAPHGLLQPILKRSLPSDCRNIPLTNRGHSNALVYLLEALGKLYMEGCDVDARTLYPKVEFPVSTKTPQVSHIVEHSHSDRWNCCLYSNPERRFASTYKPIVTLCDDEYKYLRGSIIEGKREFPIAGVLMFVWDILAMSLGEKVKGLSVLFQDLRFYDQPLLEDQRPLEFTIMLLKQSGRFEVIEDPNHIIAEGYIEATNCGTFNDFPETSDKLILTSTDVYKLLYERGYEYTDDLRSIRRANLSLTKAEIAWKGNWTTFIDGVLQLISLRHEHDGISQPSCIRRIVIDIDKHAEAIADNKRVVAASYYEIESLIRCGGVLIETVILKDKTARIDLNIGFKTLKFIPFSQEYNNDLSNLYVAMQIIAEHFGRNNIKVLSINDNPKTDILYEIKDLLFSEPEIKIDVTYVNVEEATNTIYEIEKPDLVFINIENFNNQLPTITNAIHDKQHYFQIFNHLHNSLPRETFLLMLGVDTKYINPRLFKSIFVAGKKETKLELFKWVQLQKAENIIFPVKTTSELLRLQNLRKDMSFKQSLTVLTTYPPIAGVNKIVKQLREEDSFQAHLAMINTKKAELDLKKLHNLDLAVNICKEGEWGGEYYVPLEEFQSKAANISLQMFTPRDLHSLHWVEINKNNEQGIPVTVHYVGLNFHDAKQATAEISIKTNASFGMDFSGLNESKERIMGLIPEGAACTTINFNTGLLWPVPDHWSLEDAATVPLPYCLAFYCLGIKLKLVRGMNVLIHGGAGALGQAAISIALAHNCIVFTTVSDNANKLFLRELFPDLPADHIGNSRDDSFRDMVQSLTKGEGCEILISNVKGNLKNATLSCCAMAGTTLDMVQIHDRDNFQYGMSFMTKARSYNPVDFTSVFKKANVEDLKKLKWMVSDGIARRYVRPLSRVTYAPYEVPRAFQLLAASRHRGRILDESWCRD